MGPGLVPCAPFGHARRRDDGGARPLPSYPLETAL